MAKNTRRELTWCAGTNRWRKIRRGVAYHFAARPGEKREDSYRRCLQLWRIRLVELEAAEDAALNRTAAFAAIMVDLNQSMEEARQENDAAGWRRLAKLRQFYLDQQTAGALFTPVKLRHVVAYNPPGRHPRVAPS